MIQQSLKYLVIDLGSVCELETIRIWGLNANGSSLKTSLEQSVTKLDVYGGKE